jgi:ribonuclease R
MSNSKLSKNTNKTTSISTTKNINTSAFKTYEGKVSKQKDGTGVLVDIEYQQEITISSGLMKEVMHMDDLIVQVNSYNIAKNVEIKKRSIEKLIGTVGLAGKIYMLTPDDHRLPQMYISKNSIKKFKLEDGNIVYAKIIEYPSATYNGDVEIIEVLGDEDNPNIEIDMAVRKYNLPYIFSAKVEQELTKIPNIPEKKDYTGRVDLTDIGLITIDGEDARDFDDAVYCEECITDDGSTGYRLLVAIADVSHYVIANTELDREAVNRATSVYFPRKVIPMLPEKLSNGLCSLNPMVDRLCMVCDMVIDTVGNIQAYQFYNAVMHSKARLTYNQVSKVLQEQNLSSLVNEANEKSKNEQNKIDLNNVSLFKQITDLHNVYKALSVARNKRGAIDFDTKETYMLCGENGKIEKILPRTRNDAHKLIEECMLAANVCSAKFIHAHQDGLYRIHGKPNPDKLLQLQSNLGILGIRVPLDKNKEIDTQGIASVLEQIKQRPDAQTLQTMVLRTMQQAIYDNKNIGHYGLGYAAYTHFTSPIRRYPDLLVHRTIKAILHKHKYTPTLPHNIEMHTLATLTLVKKTNINIDSNNKDNKDSKDNKGIKAEKESQDSKIWHKFGQHCSALERRADEASRDVEAWLKCYFMQSKLNEKFSGFVSAVLPFGIFVQLDDLYIDGLIHISELGVGEYCKYDEQKQQITTELSNTTYKLGTRVNITVSAVNIALRKIDFKLDVS